MSARECTIKMNVPTETATQIYGFVCLSACVCFSGHTYSIVCGHAELLSVTITHVPHYHNKPVDIHT